MWRLRARLRRAGSDRGAVAVLIAILVPVVLLGIGAFVLDVGSWYAQRAQTQNGADAGAVAVAQSCAKGACDLDAAFGYAPENSNGTMDTTAQVTTGFPCGRDTVGGALPVCPPGTENGTICPAAPPSGNYVNVATNTVGSTADTKKVPPLLGRAVAGKDYQGQEIGACAQASWGPAGAAHGVAMTIPLCNWSAATADGTTFAPASGAGVPGYTGKVPEPGTPGGEQVLLLHGKGNKCATGPGASGSQLPGGFGWLKDPNGTCNTYFSVQNEYYEKPGNAANAECEGTFEHSMDTRTPIYIPIYDSADGGGANGEYHLKGFAAFVVTGGFLKGHGKPWDPQSTITADSYCSGSQRCLYGYFTQALVPDAPGGGTVPGVNYVKLTG